MFRKTDTFGEKVFYLINTVFMVLLCILMLYPIIYVVGHSVMSDVERAVYPLRLIPQRGIDWSGYEFIFLSGTTVMGSYGVTILRTIIGTAVNIVITSLMAYPLARRDYPARRMVTVFVCFTMWFSGGLIPTFLLIRSLGLINSFWVYILPWQVNPFNLLILRNFFMKIPNSLSESARIDGANDFMIYLRVIIPLSVTSMVTIGLFYAVFHWNQWMDSMLYVTDKELWTVQYVLRQLIASTNVRDISTAATDLSQPPTADTVKMATIVVATIPILCVYPFLQKYFVKGVLVGSIKG